MRIITFFLRAIYHLLGIIPKNNNIWVIGSAHGSKYIDNSRELFEYISRNNSEIKIVWLSKNIEIIKSIRNMGFSSYGFYSIHGIYYSIISKNAIMSYSWTDLPITTFLFSKNKNLIQTWHGTPLKKVNLLNNAGKIHQIMLHIFVTYMGREYDYIFSPTELNKKIYAKIFNIVESKIIISGQPRNDAMKSCKKNTKKIVLYMPTWRNYADDILSDSNADLSQLDSFFSAENIDFIIKLHPGIKVNYAHLSQYSNIHLYDNYYTGDVYSFLCKTDILITDYSSVHFDFLLLDKPIIFFVYDREKYLKETGFYYKYDSVTPGKKCHNWNCVLSEIKRLYAGTDSYKKERTQVNNRFNLYQDFNSCERCTSFIRKLT